MKHIIQLCAAFALGALLFAGPGGHAGVLRPPSTVTHVDSAPKRVAPNGKATITMLGNGDRAFLGVLTMDAKGKVPIHRDVSEEYIYILEGSGELTIEGKSHSVKPGSAIFMPSGVEVSFTNGDSKLVALQVFTPLESAKKYNNWKPKK